MEDVNTNETELDETLDVGGDVEDEEEDTTPADDGEDDGLEYDDDGSLIIPDDEDTEEAGDTTPQAEESDPAPDAKDRRIRELEEKLTETTSAAARALAKLGIDGGDPIAGLERMGAEAEGKTVEEYRAEAQREREAAQDAALLQEVKYARIREADFAAITAEIPAAAQYKRVEDFPHFARFAELRCKGATPVEAFRATHSITETPKAAPDSKAHLRSNAVGGAKSTATTLTRSQMAEYRDMFPGMSDRDIVALHKRASTKR